MDRALTPDSPGNVLAESCAGLETDLRHENLENLVASLSPPDFGVLCRLVRKRQKFRSFEHLPNELVLLISSQIPQVTDFANFVRVSRSWETIWKQPVVLAEAAARLIRRPRLDGEPEYIDWSRFRTLSIWYLARVRGRFQSFSVHSFAQACKSHPGLQRHLHVPHGEQPHVVPERLTEHLPVDFSYGNLIWQARNNVFAIDNLYTGERTVLALDRGEDALHGRSYVLLGIGRDVVLFHCGRQMAVYHLRTEKWCRVTLPSGPAKCVTNGEVIGVVMLTREVCFWRHTGTSMLPVGRACHVPGPSMKREVQVFGVSPDASEFLTAESDLKTNTIVVKRYSQGIPVDTGVEADLKSAISDGLQCGENFIFPYARHFGDAQLESFAPLHYPMEVDPEGRSLVGVASLKRHPVLSLRTATRQGQPLPPRDTPIAFHAIALFNVSTNAFEFEYFAKPVLADLLSWTPVLLGASQWNRQLLYLSTNSTEDVAVGDAVPEMFSGTDPARRIQYRMPSIDGVPDLIAPPKTFQSADFIVVASCKGYAVWKFPSEKDVLQGIYPGAGERAEEPPSAAQPEASD